MDNTKKNAPMKIYEINWSEKEKVYFLTKDEPSTEVCFFKSLPQGIELINSLFEKYTNQKERIEPLKEYSGLLVALGEILRVFSIDSAMFLEEEVSKQEDLIEKISQIMDSGYEIMEKLNTRIKWYSQETLGPFCYKIPLDGIERICIQYEENGDCFIASQLFEAETFLKKLARYKEIGPETYKMLEKQIRKIFSEISSN